MGESAVALSSVNGSRFGRLTAIEHLPDSRTHVSRMWRWLCDCGSETLAPLYLVRRGAIRSCGCAAAAEHERSSMSITIPELVGQHGRYHDTVVPIRESLIETNYDIRTVNRSISVIDEWIFDEVFERRHVRVIERARDMWRDLLRPTHDYFPRNYDPDDEGDSFDAEHSKAFLRRARRHVGDWRWAIFENVCRWNMPTGVPGSQIARLSPASIKAAQDIVIGVAEDIARELIL